MNRIDQLQGIVYQSSAIQEFSPLALTELAQRAADNNVRHHVTGYLYYEKGWFIQYFEGDPQAVTNLMELITADPRHVIKAVLVDENLSERRFPSWSMRWLQAKDLSAVRLENILSDCLNHRAPYPEELWKKSAWHLVDSLARLRIQIEKLAQT